MNKFNTTHNRAVWFDIPVQDLDRAMAFYAAVLNIEVFKKRAGDFEFAVLEHDQGNGGCLVPDTGEVADVGVLIYLNANGRIRKALEETVRLGGVIKQDVHPVGRLGFRAVVSDSEGNCIALHSMTRD